MALNKKKIYTNHKDNITFNTEPMETFGLVLHVLSQNSKVQYEHSLVSLYIDIFHRRNRFLIQTVQLICLYLTPKALI